MLFINWLRNNKKKTILFAILLALAVHFFWTDSLRVHGVMPKNEKFYFIISFSTDTPIPLLCQDFSFGNAIWKERRWPTILEVEPDPVTGAYDVSIPLRRPGILCSWWTAGYVGVHRMNQEGEPLICTLKPVDEGGGRRNRVECKEVFIEKWSEASQYCRANGNPAVEDLPFPKDKMYTPGSFRVNVEYQKDQRDLEIDFLFDDDVPRFKEYPKFSDVWGQ